MDFCLSNEHRKYMGLKPLSENSELVVVKSSRSDEKVFVFMEDNKIIKIIKQGISYDSFLYQESDCSYETDPERTIIYPKTNRGKPKKFNYSTLYYIDCENNYFFMYQHDKFKRGYVIIGNYTNQRTYYEDNLLSGINTIEKFYVWCDNFVKESTNEDLEEVQKFAIEPRRHVNYKEGDYFRIKIGRRLYTYGRILMDTYKRVKKGMKYMGGGIGRCLIIETFHILTSRCDVTVEELKKLKVFPSQHIFDNNLYYGSYEIIGHEDLEGDVNYPIMYGTSCREKIYFQRGDLYKEIDYEPGKVIKRPINDKYFACFENGGVGFKLNNDQETIKKCIEENSNKSYWEKYYGIASGDLRSQENIPYLKEILKQFDLEYLLDNISKYNY